MILFVKIQTRREARDQELQKMRKGKAEGVIRERSARRRNLTSTLKAIQVKLELPIWRNMHVTVPV